MDVMYSRVVGTSVSLLGFGHGACVLFQYTVPVDPPNRQLPGVGVLILVGKVFKFEVVGSNDLLL